MFIFDKSRLFSLGILLTSMICVVRSCPPVWADELDDIRDKNEHLRTEIGDLRKTIGVLRQSVLSDGAEAKTEVSVPVASGEKAVTLSVSGQVSRLLMHADDGTNARWFHADNDEASTRIRFRGRGKLSRNWTVGSVIEVQFESNSSSDVTTDQETSVIDDNSFTERKLEVFVRNRNLGTLWLGQGSTASDGVMEVDLSGTGVIASSGSAGLASSIEFLTPQGARTRTDVGELFSNLDGLGRDDRLRYDTPTISGAMLSTSWVDGDEYDVALRYGRSFSDVKVAFNLAYWVVATTDNKDGFGGSASLRLPFGTSLTAGYSNEDRNGARTEKFAYFKIGHRAALIPLGESRFSADYMRGDDQEEVGASASGYGLAVVQKVDRAATELFGTLRWFEADLPGFETNDISVGAIGARVKF